MNTIYREEACRLNHELARIRSMGLPLSSDAAVDATAKSLEATVERAVTKALDRATLNCTVRGMTMDHVRAVIGFVRREIADVQWSEPVEKPAEDSVVWKPGISIRDHVATVAQTALRSCRGNKRETARMLGVTVRTVQNWMNGRGTAGRGVHELAQQGDTDATSQTAC